MRTKQLGFTLALLTLTSIPGVVHASDGKLENPLEADSLAAFLNDILEVVVIIGTPIVVFFIIYAGFLFVTARGNEEQLNRAKQTIVWTLVGAALVLGAQALSVAIKETVESLSHQHYQQEERIVQL